MNTSVWQAFGGAARYEFRMQVRRHALWVTFFALGAFLMAFQWRNLGSSVEEKSLGQIMAGWEFYVSFFLPIGVGAMLADRFPRDYRTHVEELFETVPASPGARLWGKYVGSTVATLIPFFVIYVVGIARMFGARHDLRLVPLALAAFILVNLPGLLFVAAFSIACPVVLWVPLYQFLFIGYWYWGNYLSPHVMPTLSTTWLAPSGKNAMLGLFHVVFFSDRRTVLDGVGSIALLLVGAALPLIAAQWYLRWQQARA
ncbi:MAG: hypothetical protein ACR2M3_03585 [Thermomicrobiales bacterium]